MDFSPNIWAVVAAAVSNMILGFLWYGTLFRKPWSQEMGMDKLTPQQQEQMKKGMGLSYLLAFIGALLTAYVFAHVLNAFESNSINMAVQGAFWTWLGFIVPVKYGDKLWGGKSHKLFVIEAGYFLVSLILMGIILQQWM
ncbi:MAG TPA: DUF1761 domain-containing protein [Verrucomicrobiae bacterium]|nr:DUF1761 domain-containing protein [Verrucomicrobiae bacterium]